MPRTSNHVPDHLLAGGAGILALLLYLRTLAPGVLGGDSGEYQVAAWLAGFVHPTGYPLYLMVGWLWTHLLPAGSPAWRMNLLTALCGGLAAGLVCLLAGRVLAIAAPATLPATSRRLMALFAALCFAAAPTFWSQAVVAESYPLHAAFVAAVLLSLLVWLERPAARGLYWAAGIYGLSLTHHRTMLLLAPAMLVFFWLSKAGIERSHVSLKRLAGLLLLPLSLYLYVPLRAPLAPYSQIVLSPTQTLQLYKPTAGGFVEYISGRVFAPALHTPAQALGMLPQAGAFLAQEFSWVGVGLGLIGLAWLAGHRQWAVLALTGLSFLSLVTFNVFYGIPNIWVYFIAPYLIWVLWMALGVACLADRLAGLLDIGRGRAGRAPARATWAVTLAALIFPAWLVIARYAQVDQSHNQRARDLWQPILAAPVPQGAVLLSNDRDEMVPLLYYQYVEGLRPDLVELYPQILPGPQWSDIAQVAETALNSPRPLYLVKPMPGLEVKFRLEAAGPITRVAGTLTGQPGNAGPWAFGDAIRLTGFDVEPQQLRPGSRAVVTLFWEPVGQIPGDFTTYVHLVNAGGAKVGQSDHVPGGAYYPSSLWQPGDVLVDAHTLQLAGDLGERPYRLVAGLYRRTANSKSLEPLGQPQEIGTLDDR